MEIDLNEEQAKLVVEILNNWGPLDMSDEQEDMLFRLASDIKHCSEVGTTLHLNL